MKAKVAESGRVTLPKVLRERLGIVPGTLLDFYEDQGRLIAKKAVPVDAVERVYGQLGHGRSTESVIKKTFEGPNGLAGKPQLKVFNADLESGL